MGRYTGPKHRVSRRFAENIWGSRKSPLASKPYKAGQHGRDGRRGKMSTYNRGLTEKQKLKYYYQVRERQFRRLFDLANKMAGNTGENLMQLLERRLDNMVYRMGFAPTNRAARQLVSHGHIEVNGKKVDRASFTVDIGDKVGVRTKSKNHIQVQEAAAQKNAAVSYVQVDYEKLVGELIQVPKRKDIPVIANERLVIEMLSR
ncbi:MAG: 30S ribosomal protein S4 [Planctomycetes bacterium]|nr:30S ribosomal protein S4 [Planctomycetota bacterium]